MAPSDQAPPKVVCKLHDAMISGTLCAADLELKKYVLRSQQIEASDKKTRIGEDGELTLWGVRCRCYPGTRPGRVPAQRGRHGPPRPHGAPGGPFWWCNAREGQILFFGHLAGPTSA